MEKRSKKSGKPPKSVTPATPPGATKPPPPSRANYKSLYITKDLWDWLVFVGAEQDRSAAYINMRAVEDYLRKLGHDPSKQPPPPPAGKA